MLCSVGNKKINFLSFLSLSKDNNRITNHMEDFLIIPLISQKSICRCDKVLAPKGLDIFRIITELDNKIFDNILHSFVGIGAVQIGLTDILKEMGVVPDYIIGEIF